MLQKDFFLSSFHSYSTRPSLGSVVLCPIAPQSPHESTISEEVQNMPMDMVTPHNRNKSDKLFDKPVPLEEQR